MNVEALHTAALTLLGWYLMLPPLQIVGPANDPYSLAIVDSAAPLSEWLPMMTFNTLQECDNSRHVLRETCARASKPSETKRTSRR
jgi:hypothetical protein